MQVKSPQKNLREGGVKKIIKGRKSQRDLILNSIFVIENLKWQAWFGHTTEIPPCLQE